jgi:hypothetical protein
MGRARYFVGVEVQKQRQSAFKLGSRPNFRTDHAGFQDPTRPDAIRESTIEKQTYISISWRRECQSIPIDVQAVFHSRTWEPTVLATSTWRIPCAAAPQESARSSVNLDAAVGRTISACSADSLSETDVTTALSNPMQLREQAAKMRQPDFRTVRP